MINLFSDELQQYRECLVKASVEQLAREQKVLYRIFYEEQGVCFKPVIKELINKCNDEIAMRWAEEHSDLF